MLLCDLHAIVRAVPGELQTTTHSALPCNVWAHVHRKRQAAGKLQRVAMSWLILLVQCSL